jgi:hypothetical protein
VCVTATDAVTAAAEPTRLPAESAADAPVKKSQCPVSETGHIFCSARKKAPDSGAKKNRAVPDGFMITV